MAKRIELVASANASIISEIITKILFKRANPSSCPLDFVNTTIKEAHKSTM